VLQKQLCCNIILYTTIVMTLKFSYSGKTLAMSINSYDVM